MVQAEELVCLSEGVFGFAMDASLGVVASVLLLRHTERAALGIHQALHLLHVDVRIILFLFLENFEPLLILGSGPWSEGTPTSLPATRLAFFHLADWIMT